LEKSLKVKKPQGNLTPRDNSSGGYILTVQEKFPEIVTEIPTVLLRGIAEDMAGKKLVMKIQARGPDGRVIRLRVLIDTGAEVNLIKLGVLPSSYLQPSTHPLALVTANGVRMEGGKHEATLELEFKGDREIPKGGRMWTAPAHFQDAEIQWMPSWGTLG
jgi:hypothetical protein